MRTLALASIALLAFVGCTAPVRIYPARGPLAEQRPVPVITAQVTGLASGTISLRLPSGEKCEGPWALVPQERVDNKLSSLWDSIYGQENYTAKVLGARWHGSGLISRTLGAKIELELFRETVKGSPLQGVARDDSGNEYKITQ